jgi:hypothetical protein
MRRTRLAFPVAALCLPALLLPVPALATFHLMQIEQVIGGVGGNDTLQAIQLRMRFSGQNQVSQSRLIAHDAAGANPVLLIDFGSNVTGFDAGDTVLVVTAGFAATQDPPEDFVMTPIPSSYLAGGRITFEDNGGTILWSLCWGSYAGSTTGSTTNDADGNFGPCEATALPAGTTQALRFSGSAGAMSTNNQADYGTTPGDALFTNNAGTAATVVLPPLFVNGFEDP